MADTDNAVATSEPTNMQSSPSEQPSPAPPGSCITVETTIYARAEVLFSPPHYQGTAPPLEVPKTANLRINVDDPCDRDEFTTDFRGWLDLPQGPIRVFARLFQQELSTAEKESYCRQWYRSSSGYPRVMPLLAVGHFDDLRLVLVVPDLGGADVLTYLRSHPDADRHRLLMQAAEGLAFLHGKMQIVHGNLQPRAVYINTLGDVVLDRFMRSYENLDPDPASHTLAYLAPELVLDAPRAGGRTRYKTAMSDAYAFGMLIYEILSGREPWADADPIHLLRAIVSGFFPPQPGTIGDSMWWLCTTCWNTTPYERLTISSVLDHLGSSAPRPSAGARYITDSKRVREWSERTLNVKIDGFLVDVFLPKQMAIVGGSGDVRKGYGHAPGGPRTVTVYAVKICRGKKIMSREREIWPTLSHVNILPLWGTIDRDFDDADKTRIPEQVFVSPYFERGNLVNYLVDPEALRLPLMIDVATGLDYLHNTKAIVHGDIKAENILITDAGRAVLADFGLSTPVAPRRQETRFEIRQIYTWAYCAPEVLNDNAEDPSAPGVIRSKTKMSDMYAYGLLLYQTYSGDLGRNLRDRIQLTIAMYDGRFPPRPVGRTPALCDDLWSICKRCWAKAASYRPKIVTVLGELQDLESSPERQTIETVNY